MHAGYEPNPSCNAAMRLKGAALMGYQIGNTHIQSPANLI